MTISPWHQIIILTNIDGMFSYLFVSSVNTSVSVTVKTKVGQWRVLAEFFIFQQQMKIMWATDESLIPHVMLARNMAISAKAVVTQVGSGLTKFTM